MGGEDNLTMNNTEKVEKFNLLLQIPVKLGKKSSYYQKKKIRCILYNQAINN